MPGLILALASAPTSAPAADFSEALATAARSPFDIQRFVLTHGEFEWAALWKALNIQGVSLPACTINEESAPACSADLLPIFNPAQTILVLRHASQAADVYLRFVPSVNVDRSVYWRFTGSYQPKVTYFHPRYRLFQFGKKPFLVVAGHNAGVDDASGELEEWIDLTALPFTPAFHYTSRGRAETSAGIRREIWATVVSFDATPVETIRVSRQVTFWADDFDGSMALGQKTAMTVYTRPQGNQFVFNPALSTSTEGDTAEFYENLDQALSIEEFVHEDLAQLTAIAGGPEGREKQWLRTFVPRCKDSSEKRDLGRLLEAPAATAQK